MFNYKNYYFLADTNGNVGISSTEQPDYLNEEMESKQRHGCLTAWLVLSIVLNSLGAMVYLFAGDMITKNLPKSISYPMSISLALLGIANVIFSVLLLQWKKLGFWGFTVTSILTFIVNINIGLGVGQSLFGLVGIAILYGVLQIKKGNATAWDNLQ